MGNDKTEVMILTMADEIKRLRDENDTLRGRIEEQGRTIEAFAEMRDTKTKRVRELEAENARLREEDTKKHWSNKNLYGDDEGCYGR